MNLKHPLSILVAVLLVAGAPVRAAEPRRVPDTMAERVAACTTCHGKEGRAAADGYFPRIAGKPSGYLYNQLVNFREGRRKYALMAYLVDHLTDAYLREIAEHFAALDLPYPPPQAGNATPQVLAQGAALARKGDPGRNLPACVQCHGQALTGADPAIPGLLGLARDYLHGQLGHWKSGERRAHAPDCMSKVAGLLTDEEIGAVSSWLASQPVPGNARAAPRAADPLPMECGAVARLVK